MSNIRPSHPIDFAALNAQIAPPDEHARKRANDRWNSIAKPIAGLGMLETAVEQIAAIQGTESVDISKRAVVVMCADNGVVCEGISQSMPDVTTAVANNIARNASSVCAMAKPAGAQVVGVDVGMLTPANDDRIWDYSVARGTGNIAVGPAMSPGQTAQAIAAGIEVSRRLKEQEFNLLCTGEMSIGNTTTSSAMAAVLLDLPVEQVTGRGAGLSDAGLERKVNVIKQAIQANEPDPQDAFDVLRKLGGFDIAGLVGLFIGAGINRIPTVIDGYISAIAAYVATQLCPNCQPFLLASHMSTEPATVALFDRLNMHPIILAGLHLGEGTGAVLLPPILDSALGLYNGTTFSETGIEAYEVDLH